MSFSSSSDIMGRAQFYMEHQRWPDAVRELRSAVAANPDIAYPHALLAICLSEANEPNEALRSARQAVHLGPDQDFSHYAMASVLEDMHRLPEAERAIRQALQIDSINPHYFARLGSILLQQSRWREAVNAAEAGLLVNSQDVTCTNIRAMALVKLGQQDHAHRALDTALSYEPENAVTHANRGWALLHQNRPKEACDHFREALRLDPTQMWAREGIIEALRARNPVYRLLLAFFLWMSRLSPGTRMALIVGLWFGNQFVQDLARQNPPMAPTLNVISFAYVVFVFLTWTAGPLFDLLLRLDSTGRMALTRDRIVVSNWVGALLLGSLACLSIWLQNGNAAVGLAAIICAMMILPVAGAFGSHNRRRPWLKYYAVALGAVGLGAVIQEATIGNHGMDLLGIFLLGFAAFTWIAGLASAR